MYTDQPLNTPIPKKSSRRRSEPEIVRNGVCLMMNMPNYNIFTYKRNFRCLIELCKKLKASLSLVKVTEVQLSSLKEIATTLSNPEAPTLTTEYTVVRKKFVPAEGDGDIPNRKQKILEIKQTVRNEMLKNGTVTVNSLGEVLVKYDLTKNQLRYYLNSVKKIMELEGYSFQ